MSIGEFMAIISYTISVLSLGYKLGSYNKTKK